ncbi:MFS transporter [Aurantiacibacter gangjinensis]|uniref:2-oxoglutarate dehydrogenase E1 component n=1 Tax=Aurantiacibacter gangjinensis TaxID=502682 RepID=A0A0G9MSG1_9SPHN|nr:MFS transporter [Aurantiacibacter gangjinensis]
MGEALIPDALTTLSAADVGLSRTDLFALLETQMRSRRLDLESRKLAGAGKTFYSIGSSGHEGNAAVARVFRRDDIAFLHYRSGAFLIERAGKLPGTTPLWDMALSFAASSEDPVSGGRHKVIGSAPLCIPPQTSTIASHLPKAVGAAWSIGLSKHQKRDGLLPPDSVAICSFGDASSNHSTAQGAFNAAAWTAYRGLPLPLVFVCEDNGIGISVPTPESWVRANFSQRPGLHYIGGDARDIADAMRAASEAERFARLRRRPVFLHLRTVRLMGHAGSDVEMQYRSREEIEREADQDPLLHTARHALEAGATLDDIRTLYSRISGQVAAVMEQAAQRPRLTTSQQVSAPLAPRPAKRSPERPASPPPTAKPQHMSRAISATLAQEMERDADIIVFGEDVGRKGGVYGATTGLQKQFGISRVFDTLLDEQTILGLAIGAAHNGHLPIPEIQFLAYVHNAEDQIRGEAATLSFFSDAQYANPMVIRIAGLAYQKGFGGHFHNDNAIGVFRDIPGIVLACPSSAAEAVLLLREAIRLAREEKRVVIFLEPIALYNVKDLYQEGDGKMLADLSGDEEPARFGEVVVHPAARERDLTILTYGNGTYFARRCQKRLAENDVAVDVIDLRWLVPLPVEDMLARLDRSKPILIVDECRKSGSPSEEIITHLVEAGIDAPIRRITGDDCFIPLGPAANAVLLQEGDIMAAALDLAGKGR